MNTLPDLLNTLDDQASLANRHIWLIALLQWIRGDESTPEASVSRLQTFMVAVEEQPEVLARLRAWWRVLMQTVDVTTLLAALFAMVGHDSRNRNRFESGRGARAVPPAEGPR